MTRRSAPDGPAPAEAEIVAAAAELAGSLRRLLRAQRRADRLRAAGDRDAAGRARDTWVATLDTPEQVAERLDDLLRRAGLAGVVHDGHLYARLIPDRLDVIDDIGRVMNGLNVVELDRVLGLDAGARGE